MKSISLFAALLFAITTAFAEDPATFDVGGFKFTRPAEWTWVAVNSPMRKAQLAVPGAEPKGEITFFHFGPGGGNARSNVQRWFNQFQGSSGAEKTEEMTAGKTKITLASTEGTYSSGMPGGPTTPLANFALLGAILDSPEGLVFVKFTGPAALVKGSREKFVDFVKSAAETAK